MYHLIKDRKVVMIMNFKRIDINTWPRKEYFNHYFTDIPCTYSMCVKIDITHIINNNIKLYPALIYCITTVVNSHEEFRTSYSDQQGVIIYDTLNPSYTIFHEDDHTFSNLWTTYQQDFNDFIEEYNKDMQLYKNNHGLNSKPNIPENTFPISMIPWSSFEGFNLNLQKGYAYLLPIFTMGKYTKNNNRIELPLSIQVHHAICDGFHVSRFINELQELVNTL